MATALVLTLVIVTLTHVPKASSFNKSCPTWLYLSEEGWCTCGSSLLNVIMCNNISQQVGIQNSFCLTSFNPDQDPKEPVVGRCIYAQNHGKYMDRSIGLYINVDQNISQQDYQLCDYLNREGRLCGACKHNHYISSYSYDLKCYECQGGLVRNAIIYFTVAYVPLTVFLVLVVAFHISVASPRLNVAILLCQIYAEPSGLRVLIHVTRNTNHSPFIKFFATVYGIWNLDFFRVFVPPICLPLNTMQVIALDYLVAIYPLLLLVCFYILVTAHDRGYSLVVRLWRPFLWCSARIRQQWNAKHSIIDAFATFILLSYVKFISVSADLLNTTKIFKRNGDCIGRFMYYDATVEFMGQEHMPYFIIATTVLFIAILFPLLLILYPMKWFQVFLNKCHLNSPGLRMFMECFQGYYHDRSDGGWDCRWFAALYPSLRIAGSIMYALTHSDLFFPILALDMTIAMLVTLLVSPYKKRFNIYHKLDLALLISIIITSNCINISLLFFDWNEINPAFGFILSGLACFSPLLYLIGLILKRMIHVLKTKQFFLQIRRIKCHMCNRQKRREYEELGASEPLINSAT